MKEKIKIDFSTFILIEKMDSEFYNSYLSYAERHKKINKPYADYEQMTRIWKGQEDKFIEQEKKEGGIYFLEAKNIQNSLPSKIILPDIHPNSKTRVRWCKNVLPKFDE